MAFRHPVRDGPGREWLGVLLLLGGVGLLAGIYGFPGASPGTGIVPLATEFPPGGKLAGLPAPFPVERLERYEVRQGAEHTFTAALARYRDGTGTALSALVYLPEPGAAPRAAAWAQVAAAVPKYTGEGATFLTWWDNAQRVHFLIGRAAGPSLPLAAAFPDPAVRAVWERLGGGWGEGDALRDLAALLTMDAEAALKVMRARYPATADARVAHPLHVLVTVDDLARIAEMEALGGRKLGLGAARFAAGADLHVLIAEVKRWAGTPPGTGSYLVTRRGGVVVAWRINDPQTADSLLVRLLPFTSSLGRPLAALPLVYQTDAGYLSLYAWHPERGEGRVGEKGVDPLSKSR
jgi:hydroxylamine oxidation protein HaoB